MAELGLIRFAWLALEVSEAALCLMRYEDWTFREAEVRLSEHSELRSTLQLSSVLDYTTHYRFLTRLGEEDVARVLEEIVRRMPGRWRSPATAWMQPAWRRAR